MRQDKAIKCQNCRQDFIWTEEEQDFYRQKGLAAPKFCLICRSTYKTAQKDNFRNA